MGPIRQEDRPWIREAQQDFQLGGEILCRKNGKRRQEKRWFGKRHQATPVIFSSHVKTIWPFTQGVWPVQLQELTEAEESFRSVPDKAGRKQESPGKGCSVCQLSPTVCRQKSAETLPACTQTRGRIFNLTARSFSTEGRYSQRKILLSKVHNSKCG